jgi:hypothetical protein
MEYQLHTNIMNRVGGEYQLELDIMNRVGGMNGISARVGYLDEWNESRHSAFSLMIQLDEWNESRTANKAWIDEYLSKSIKSAFSLD